ncbi:MAG: hypothetical protein OJJ21_19290 [Ferrovibrio sp.]|uniref:hypothetical protein n=1 Tax=Ferrovibrio sp. TaxID=1917215 RepID=UPI00261BA04E|nr:hypothetical protein [Ferrovibrio sp.]MCW0235753.1 hypothetical protein [Ferrovibrio sp.]
MNGENMALTVEDLLGNPTTSEWLQAALRSALERDAVDAANDAAVLLRVLMRRAEELPEIAVQASPSSTDIETVQCASKILA